MKKSLLALAVLGAFAGAAQAQSSVQIYGSFDGGVRYVNNANAAGDDRWTVGSNGTYNSNRLGFKGVEDLGGGLNAHFTLETGFNTGTGALENSNNQLFGRAANVGIGGSWGSLDFGRQYSASFKVIGRYDPFNYKYTGIVPLATAAAGSQGSGANPVGFGSTRFNNDVQYSGTFGPVTAYAEYAFGEVAGDNSAGRGMALGGVFATGPFVVGGAYTKRDTNGTLPFPGGIGAGAGTLSNDQWTVGGAYTFGPARLAAGYIDETQDRPAGGETEVKHAWIGGSFAVGPALELSAAYYNTKADVVAGEGKRDLYIIGATYALSKRTNVYTEVDYNRYKDVFIGPAANPSDTVTGFSIGINHLF